MSETADSNPDVRYTRLYDPGVGYVPGIPAMLSRLSKYTPVSAGPIAIPMNSISALTPTDIPMNDLGDDDTTMFHVAVIVINNRLLLFLNSSPIQFASISCI